MPEKSEEVLHISEQFYKNTYFPNIIGAIDGKHIRIIQPQMTGSEFFNYEKLFSVVLMAMLMVWFDDDYQYCIYVTTKPFEYTKRPNIAYRSRR